MGELPEELTQRKLIDEGAKSLRGKYYLPSDNKNVGVYVIDITPNITPESPVYHLDDVISIEEYEKMLPD